MTAQQNILIKKFFRNECTAFEAAAAYELLRDHPEIIDKYLSNHEFDAYKALDLHMPKSVKRRLQKKVFQNTTSKYSKRSILATVASVACMMILTIAILFLYSKPKNNNLARLSGETSFGNIDAHLFRKQTTISLQNATKRQIRRLLPDKSVVLLQPGASLQLAKNFATNRKIELTGNAYFIVQKNKQYPFEVSQSGIKVIALGTEFWVCSQKEKNIITVKLKEGKVRVQAQSSDFYFPETILNPGEDLLVDKINGAITLLNNTPSTKNKPLHFNKNKQAASVNINEREIKFNYTPLKEVFRVLEDRYKVTIITDKRVLADQNQFTGKFYIKDSIETIIDNIKLLHNFEYDYRKGDSKDTIYIQSLSAQSKINIIQKLAPVKNTEIISLTPIPDKAAIQRITATRNYSKTPTSNSLVFNQTPLDQVFYEIEKQFSLKIRMLNPQRCTNTFTGKIMHYESAEIFIKNICTLNDLKVNFDKDHQMVIIE